MNISNYDFIKRKFYMKDINYTGFSSFNEESLKKVNQGIEIISKKFKEKKENIHNLSSLETNKYIEFLSYFCNSNNYTYDEKIYMLITIFDPNLFMYKLFMKTNFISSLDIQQAKSMEEKIELKRQKQIILDEYKEQVRKQIGFYEPSLVKYEKDYYFRFLNHEYALDNTLNFFYDDPNIDFNSLSEEDKERINKIADTYVSKFGKNPEKLKKLLINDLYSFNLKNNTEAAYMFIMSLDPNLNLLDIYIMESRWDHIKEECLREYGFFSAELINIENKYNNSLGPNKKKTF